jgi:hypothetical protein
LLKDWSPAEEMEDVEWRIEKKVEKEVRMFDKVRQ